MSVRQKISNILKYIIVFSALGGTVYGLFTATGDGYSHWSKRLLYFTTQSNVWVGIIYLIIIISSLFNLLFHFWGFIAPTGHTSWQFSHSSHCESVIGFPNSSGISVNIAPSTTAEPFHFLLLSMHKRTNILTSKHKTDMLKNYALLNS